MTCRALAGEVVLTNGPRIELDDHWRVEHCHPVAIPGWLVLVLRRHARSLHELSDAESAALGRWIAHLPKALHAATGCELEYVMQFAEGDGFHHVHVHFVARAAEWRPEWKGPDVFSAFGVDDPIDSDRVTEIMNAVANHLDLKTTPIAKRATAVLDGQDQDAEDASARVRNQSADLGSNGGSYDSDTSSAPVNGDGP